LKVGDPAPDFTLPSTAGEKVSLSDFRDRTEVVLFFYPKDNSPACSAEACSFRDHYDAFRDAGAQVIGVSGDSLDLHRRFIERFSLPFPLLSDVDSGVQARYGVAKLLGIIPGRVTFLIDRQGIIRHVFSSQVLFTKHVAEALRVLQELRGRSLTG
jgi:peroxiredoxin Q/BCP